MDNQKLYIPVNTALTPVCYKDFQCLAADCQDDCCHGWRISFNKKDFLSMRREDAPAAFKERLDRTVRRIRVGDNSGIMYAQFKLNADGRCPMQDPDGLCSLQKTCGHDALPYVCQSYPRKTTYTPAARELSLSPSCEGVLQLLWDHPEGLDFVEEDLPKIDRRRAIVRIDHPTMSPLFAGIRSLCVDILQNRALPLPRRVLLLGVALDQLGRLDWNDLDITPWAKRFSALAAGDGAAERLQSMTGDPEVYVRQNITLLLRLADSPWAMECLKAVAAKQTSDGKISYDAEAYQARRDAFAEAFPDVEYFFENLMVAILLYLGFPALDTRESLWKSYVNLCNLYSIFRFAAVTGCGAPPEKAALFHTLVMVSRSLLHNSQRQMELRDKYFQNDSATLAHMAMLLGD